MSLERARQSIQRLSDLALGRTRVASFSIELEAATALQLFESQLRCRLIDLESHQLRARGQGYYTICSAGHEGNAVLGRLTAPTDPALLHYRSGAFYLERARQVPHIDPVMDLLLSLTASSEDPISGGRHKVFGSVPLGIPPQTSTIASHLPKAVGMAVAIERAHRMEQKPAFPRDAIVLCSFGDASLNHSTAQGALNSAAWAAFQRLPAPILFVCEDNGLGVSVRSPPRWIESRMRAMPAISYYSADATDLDAAWRVAAEAVSACRQRRSPVFLHLFCERLWGHAGSDADSEYRTREEIALAEGRDPVARTAQALLDAGILSSAKLLEWIAREQDRVATASAQAVQRPKLRSRPEVMRPIAPSRPKEVALEARRDGYAALPEDANRPRPLAHLIRLGLADLMHKYSEMLVFGEDVAQKGGVYGATSGLWKTFGAKRVFNTLLDEQTILGLAIGAGQMGLLPVPEIQFLAYLHNAEDQIRGEASTLSFFSNGQLKNPMVVRIAGLGYQKGFGGHFHNENSLAVLRDVPGLIVGVPSRGDDAVKMLRTCLAAAKVDGRVCVLVEPIALYPVRDLYPDDAQWSFPFPAQNEAIDVGEVGVYGAQDRDLAIVTYGNGVPICLRVRDQLAKRGIRARVIDLRWLSPLPEGAIRSHAIDTGKVLVVDECRRSANVSEGIATCLLEDEKSRVVSFARVTAADSFIPLADAAQLVLPDENEVLQAAVQLLGKAPRGPAQ